MSRMFLIDGKPMITWNCYVGCRHDCTYCNARRLALTRLKHHPQYKHGFKPHLVEERLRREFKPGEFIFVAYMGDLAFASPGEFLRILARIKMFPKTDFLICTKNPGRICGFLLHWGIELPANVVLGTTIESNIDHGLSQAPPPRERFLSLAAFSHPRKFLSIEPICDFNLETLVAWAKLIKPEIIEVGCDNYHHNLPEPSWEKVEELLKELRKICPRVVEKDGLRRLKRKCQP